MRILLVSAMRDEGPHLLEWIAHHRAIGVTDFLIYSNDCSDGTDAMLDALAPFGVVHVRNVPPEGKSIQWNALREAWAHDLRAQADWLLCIDTDEFINLRAPLNTLSDLVAEIGDADAITLPWRLFGHAGRPRLTNDLTTEVFNRASPPGCDYPIGARQFKTLFRAKGAFRQMGVHRPRPKKAAVPKWVDGSGNALPEAFVNAGQRITLYGTRDASDLVQLNHYSVRSAESFMLKRARGLPNRKDRKIDLTYWVERNFNIAEDKSIHRHLPATKEILSEMMANEQLSELHAGAHAHHHAEFLQIMKDGAAVKFFGRLMLAASSHPLPTPLIQQLVSMYQSSQGDG